MTQEWPDQLPVVQVRMARPTRSLEKILQFYRDGLGLPVVGSFEDQAGYSGVMIGLPGFDYHLEFTTHPDHKNLDRPHEDDLLVLYMPNREAIGRLVVRLGAMGYRPTAPLNPYWENKSVTIPDPDGRRVVLVETAGIGSTTHS